MTHVQAHAIQSSPADLRRAERHDVSFPTRLSTSAGGFRAQLVNLSRLGFMVRAEDVLPEHAELVIALPAIGPRKAVTVWCLGGRIGGEFSEPIEAADFDLLIQAAKLVRPSWPA